LRLFVLEADTPLVPPNQKKIGQTSSFSSAPLLQQQQQQVRKVSPANGCRRQKQLAARPLVSHATFLDNYKHVSLDVCELYSRMYRKYLQK
jgi:hypothetical protein